MCGDGEWKETELTPGFLKWVTRVNNEQSTSDCRPREFEVHLRTVSEKFNW